MKFLVCVECEGMVIEAKDTQEAWEKAEDFMNTATPKKILDEVKLHLRGVEEYE